MAARFTWLPRSEMSIVTGLRLGGKKVHAGQTGNPAGYRRTKAGARTGKLTVSFTECPSHYGCSCITGANQEAAHRNQKPSLPQCLPNTLTGKGEIFTRCSPASVMAMKQGNNRWISRWKAIIWHKIMLFTNSIPYEVNGITYIKILFDNIFKGVFLFKKHHQNYSLQ